MGGWESLKRESWGKFAGAGAYETRIGSYADRIDTAAVSTLLAGSRGRILDIPCGAGRMSRRLEREPGLRVVSADYSPGMLGVARGRVASPLVRCDAFALPFRDSSFDRVLMLRLVFHYAEPLAILREAARVLAPGGELVFDTLNRVSSRRAAEIVLRIGRRSGAPGVRFLAPAQVFELAADAGLEIAARDARFLLPTRAYRAVPRWAHRVLQETERLVPSGLRVLSYWRARKPR